LPFSYRDEDLSELCLQHATKKATIRECRIMRNKKGKDEKGRLVLGKSKGFGFVEFTEHLDALTCLRNLNNNPNIFTDKKVNLKNPCVI
jgi:RNA recognition motif-containing protein